MQGYDVPIADIAAFIKEQDRYRGFAGSRILYESNRCEYAEADQ